MTTHHLDDESLSAAYDGEATPADQAHLTTCPHCQAALGLLDAVAREIGAPVAPRSPEAINAAIARAVRDSPLPGTPAVAGTAEAAWAAGAATATGTTGTTGTAEAARAAGITGTTGAAGVARAAGTTGTTGAAPSSLAGNPRRRRGNRQPPAWILGAAGIAAAVALVAVVAIVGRSHSRTTATSPALSSGAAAASTTAPSSRTSGLASDLGDQSDPGVVARLALAASRPLGAATGNAAPVPTAASPAASHTLAPELALAATPCAAEARFAVDVPPDRPVQYAASLRWRGQEAVVVVFSAPKGLAGVIMKVAGCSELVVLPTP